MVGEDAANIFDIGGVNNELSVVLTTHFSQFPAHEVVSPYFHSHNFASARHFETGLGTFMGFHLRHCLALPLSVLPSLLTLPTFRPQA